MNSIFLHINKNQSAWRLRIVFVHISSFSAQLIVSNIQAYCTEVIELNAQTEEGETELNDNDKPLAYSQNSIVVLNTQSSEINPRYWNLFYPPQLGIRNARESSKLNSGFLLAISK